MATISGGSKRTRALVTLDCETVFPEGFAGPEIVRHRFVLRSDGALLQRVVSYRPEDGSGPEVRPSSGFRIARKYDLSKIANPASLRPLLVRKVEAQGLTVVGA